MLTQHGALRHKIDQVVDMPRLYRKALMVCADLLLIPVALWISLSLRLGEFYSDFDNSLILFAAVPFFTVPIFARLGLYRAILRYAGRNAIQQLFAGVVLSAAIVLVLTLINWPNGLPRSMFAIYGFVAFTLLGSVRLAARMLFGGRIESRGKAVAIYGAGVCGRQLYGMLRASDEYRPVVFLDDSREFANQEVSGLRVLRPSDPKLESRLTRAGVDTLFLAMPSISRAETRRILQSIEELPLHVYTVPDLNELVSGTAAISQLREVPIEDLLGRDPVPPNEELLGRCVTDRRVLVTGAGGSIGTELCRQLIEQRPEALVLVDNSEFSLFRVETELRQLIRRDSLDLQLVPMLADVCDQTRMEQIIAGHEIATVYHAAAYKHVPIVERDPVEGVRNNVMGTLNVARLSQRHAVRDFVLISTDKAVRPTNVMGASKRLSELVLQDLAGKPGGDTRFSMVRFGNVLGSSGSVVPMFRTQIAEGGPVTVTHAEINRYFMTTSEAVQLVIQAGAMAEGGDVFVLDMGEPVKILDLARQMIHLSGLQVRDEHTPDGEIEITYSGLRPGEKLFEELLIGDDVSGTRHPKIMRALEDSLPDGEMQDVLASLQRALQSYDLVAVRAILKRTVRGYQQQQAVVQSDDAEAEAEAVGNVLQLPRR